MFLSHQSADSFTAAHIAQRLRNHHGIDSYLDVIDPFMARHGEDLAAHIQTEMSKCTQLLAVVSEATKNSQWVPWEIGVATEKSYPLATYFADYAAAPEFLRKWPYLRSDFDIDRYAQASKAAQNVYLRKRATLNESAARAQAAPDFFRTLRNSLGQ